jgi:hypothetical protein
MRKLQWENDNIRLQLIAKLITGFGLNSVSSDFYFLLNNLTPDLFILKIAIFTRIIKDKPYFLDIHVNYKTFFRYVQILNSDLLPTLVV